MNAQASTLIDDPSYTMGTVTSKDGTKIGYRRTGQGPGIVLVQGAMGTAYNYQQLAADLANEFTVYVPDRRGRGMSPREYGTGHSIQNDVDDLDSMLTHAGAHFVFGLSSGAIITLEASRLLPSIHRAAIYEPPFYLEGVPVDKITRVYGEIARGDLASALVTVGSIVKLGPAFLSFIPRPLLKLVVARVLRNEQKNGRGKYAPLRELIPAMRYDFKVVLDRGGRVELFEAVKPEILLLGGTKSPAYLKNALAALERTLPKARRTEFTGLDHSAAWNVDRGGAPGQVAQSLRQFFTK